MYRSTQPDGQQADVGSMEYYPAARHDEVACAGHMTVDRHPAARLAVDLRGEWTADQGMDRSMAIKAIGKFNEPLRRFQGRRRTEIDRCGPQRSARWSGPD